ncbi:hypothetical protein [Rhodococcus sp. JG-3]|nr:hypothetical protein [Rhodococcus sp. JG-3]
MTHMPGDDKSDDRMNDDESATYWTPAKTLAAAAVTVVALAVGVVFGAKVITDSPEDSISDVASSDDFVAFDSEGTVPEVEITEDSMNKMSSQAFSELPDSVRLDHYGPRIDEWRADAYSYLIPAVGSREKEFFNNDLPEDKSEYTPQQIANQVAIDLYDASSQDGKTDESKEEGRKMLSVIMSPQNAEFSESISIINGPNAIRMVNEVHDTYPRLKNVTFRGRPIGPDGAELMVLESNSEGRKYFGLYQLLTTPNGNSIWQFTDTFAYNDLTIHKDIKRAVSESHE